MGKVKKTKSTRSEEGQDVRHTQQFLMINVFVMYHKDIVVRHRTHKLLSTRCGRGAEQTNAVLLVYST